MVVAQICFRTVSTFTRALTTKTNACKGLLPNSLGPLSGQLCFTAKRCRSLVCKSSNHADAHNHSPEVSDMGQLREEVDRQSKEIRKLRAAISSALRALKQVGTVDARKDSKKPSESRKRKDRDDDKEDPSHKRQNTSPMYESAKDRVW